MRKHRIINFYICLVGLVLLSIPKSAFSKTFKCNWGNYNPPPYIIFENDSTEPTKGLIVDFCELFAKELGLEPKLVKTPRKRAVELCQAGATDVIITGNKTWLPPLVEDGNWLPSIFEISNTLAFHKKSRELTGLPLTALENLTISATHGYIYRDENLISKFKSGTLRRVDAKNEFGAAKMVSSGRTDAAIVERITFSYQQTIHPNEFGSLLLSRENITSNEITPVVCKSSPLDFNKLEKVAKRLKKQGAFKKIMAKYK